MTRPHILLVEDEALIRWSLAARLAEAGFRVSTAADGTEALELLQEGHPDLLVTDYRMNGLDGLTLAREARRRQPSLPVVLITAFRTPELDEACHEAGITVCLDKPFELPALLEAIRGSLGEKEIPWHRP